MRKCKVINDIVVVTWFISNYCESDNSADDAPISKLFSSSSSGTCSS